MRWPAVFRPVQTLILAWLVGLILLLLVFLVPFLDVAVRSQTDGPAPLSFLWWSGRLSGNSCFVAMSVLGGALGGALHAIASLSAHLALGDFDDRWTAWYLTNPFVGAGLATMFLFVLQAGLGGQSGATPPSLYGVAAAATLSGLFSRHALRKLKEVFDVLFASREPAGNPAPSGATETPAGRPGDAAS